MEYDLAILFAITILLALLRLLPEFRIWVTPISVECSGALLQGHESAITYLFHTVLKSQGPLKVTGRQTGHGRLKLRFYGEISTGDRQQVRDFLSALLRL